MGVAPTFPLLDGLEALRFPDVTWDERDRPVLIADGRVMRVRELDATVTAQAAHVFGLNQREVDRVSHHLRTVGLRMTGCHAEDLTGLTRIGPLRQLAIEWNPKVTSLDPIGELAELEVLSIVDTSKTRDLAPLLKLGQLRALAYAGGWNSTSTAISLEPVGQLAGLEELRLLNLNVREGGLRPLAGCRALRSLELSNEFPTSDYAYLSVKLPETSCESFAPFIRLEEPMDDNDVMVVGSRKPFLHSTRDAARLQRYVDEFRRLQASFADSP